MTREELPTFCKNGGHVPVIVHRTGGLDAALHNTCGKCGRMILNLAGTWIVDAYREEMFDESLESQATAGLDVAHYPFKWKQAQKLAQSNERQDDNRLLPYWERVRLLFLELGGEFIDGHRE